MQQVEIPESLRQSCGQNPGGLEWLDTLHRTVRDLQARWSLTLNSPFDGEEVSCSWIASGTRGDGTAAVLKIGFPHMEAEHEVDALRFWNGDGAVRVLEADQSAHAMLLERCLPGTPLRSLSEFEQDRILAVLLQRIWRHSVPAHPFRPLSQMTEHWAKQTQIQYQDWPDKGLVLEALRLFDFLNESAPSTSLLATDLHAGNILKANREPWLIIDPKPFIGDRAYDATQHLLNCKARLYTDPESTIQRFADLLQVSAERVRLWTFARAAGEPRERWSDDPFFEWARSIAP